MDTDLHGRARTPTGLNYLLASPGRGSASKRLNLFLRWMVREDEVDVGFWKSVDKAKLIVPVDVHMGRLCRILGFHDSKAASLSTAVKITEAFAQIEPADPAKYDFALSRIGILEDCTGRRRVQCRECELCRICERTGELKSMNSNDLEKYSSAITLSDMELFVFPELIYSLVLANIMSPVIWKWRELESFEKLAGKSSYRRLMRLRQFIMDEFDFNLDLETWGLTNKDIELKRFERYMSPQQIAASNALFGYEGDKYYFDVDIRRHFGLDKYTTDIIPYWKTETVEAMDAFRLKPGYGRAAGECVSLATLYAAAAFIVCGVPLEDIYMILTPLHSQNFIDMQDGILTNNRRLVTKTMWFNGTEISNKAQRALRNEQVTVVAHNTGVIHCLYDDATIDPKAYEHFETRLADYLSTELDMTVFASFLRSESGYQKYFQICRDCHGQPQFIQAELLYHYEHGSPFKIGDATHDKLLAEVSDEDFVPIRAARPHSLRPPLRVPRSRRSTSAGPTAARRCGSSSNRRSRTWASSSRSCWTSCTSRPTCPEQQEVHERQT